MKFRYVGLLVAVACLALAGVTLKDRFLTPETPRYLTAPVVRGDLEETVLATGTLKPSRLVAVGSQVSGRITALKVKLGDTVKTGDLVAQIDSVTRANDLRTAKAALANVKAQQLAKEAELDNARRILARQDSIVASRAGPIADLETAQANVKIAEAQIAQLAAQTIEGEVAVETAEANLGYTRITAPMDGTVVAIVNQEGRTVNAAQSVPTIVILADLTSMTVRAEISEADVIKVRPGQKIRFNIIGDPEISYDALLDRIEPAPESITGDSAVASSNTTSSSSSSAIYYIGLFEVLNTDGKFRTYMSAQVHIVLGEVNGVLTIPASALGPAEKDGSYRVRVLADDGRVTSQRVEIGLNNKIVAEVKAGLREGQQIVIGQGGADGAQAAANRRRPGGGPMGF